jgi:ankyrin repeat protein
MTWRNNLRLNNDIIWYLDNFIKNDLMKRKCSKYVTRYKKGTFDEIYLREDTELIQYFLLHYPGFLPTSRIIYDIAKTKDLDKFKFLYENYQDFTPDYPGQHISNDTSAVIVYKRALRYAIAYNQLDIVKFLFEKLKINDPREHTEFGTYYEFLAEVVLHGGYLEIAKYIFGVIPVISPSCLHLACTLGYLEIVKFFYEKNSKKTLFTPHIVNLAAGEGRLEILIFLIETCKIKITRKTISCAARNNHLDVIKYLVERINNDPKMKQKIRYYIDKAIPVAEKKGIVRRFAIIQYLTLLT